MPWFFSLVQIAPMGGRLLTCKSKTKCPVERGCNSSPSECGGCNDRISLTRPRAPEITLNKSTYVEKFNLFERQTFTAASLGHKVGQVSSGTVA